MKIIIDTNIWISYFICKTFDELKNILLNEKIEIVFSNDLLTEIKNVIKRPKFEKIIDNEKTEEILNIIMYICKFYNPTENIELCRDRKDDFLLNLASEANADFLITGDLDLLELKNYKRTKIVNWKYFISNVYGKL